MRSRSAKLPFCWWRSALIIRENPPLRAENCGRVKRGCARTRVMAHFLAIDGGGTTTTCAVADERTVLATVTASASNIIRVGEEQARNSLHSAIRQACSAARVNPTDV